MSVSFGQTGGIQREGRTGNDSVPIFAFDFIS